MLFVYESFTKIMCRVIIFISLSYCLVGCTTLNKNGELVRHHIGYIRLVTPAKVAENKPLQVLEVKTFGMWMDIDKRITSEHAGSGGGIGYRFDRRELVPLSCKVVFRVKNKEQIKFLLELLKNSTKGEKGICIIRDSQKQSSFVVP